MTTCSHLTMDTWFIFLFNRQPFVYQIKGNLTQEILTQDHMRFLPEAVNGEKCVCLSARLDLRMDTERSFAHTDTRLKSDPRPTVKRSNPHLHPGWDLSTTLGNSLVCGPCVLRGSFELFTTR